MSISRRSFPSLGRLETGLLGVTPWTLRAPPGTPRRGQRHPLRRLRAQARRLTGLPGACPADRDHRAADPRHLALPDRDLRSGGVDALALLVPRRSSSIGSLARGSCWASPSGIGLEIKYLILPLDRRHRHSRSFSRRHCARDLRTRYPWIGGSADAAHLDAERRLADRQWLSHADLHPQPHGSISNPGEECLDFLVCFLVLLFLLTPLWIAGFVSLFRNPRSARRSASRVRLRWSSSSLSASSTTQRPPSPSSWLPACSRSRMSSVERLRSALISRGRRCEPARTGIALAEDHRPDHARRSIARDRPRYPEHGPRIHRRVGARSPIR